MKKTFIVLLSLLLVFGVASFALTAAAEETPTYAVGDHIQFGSYPQTQVDETPALRAAAQAATWKSYGYYVGTGDSYDGQMQPSDFMQFADFLSENVKYRAVTFSAYRPGATGDQPGSGEPVQEQNGYEPDTIYYFKYEPLTWRVLDPSSGLVLCEGIIDAQPFQNTVYYDGSEYYQAIGSSVFANNYAHASIRDWLNTDFLATAFTPEQKTVILTTTLNNDAWFEKNAKFNAEATNDKIFLLSHTQATNSAYGFNPDAPYSDEVKQMRGTDYAKCQGLRPLSWQSGLSWWWLRTPHYNQFTCSVTGDGSPFVSAQVNLTREGVVPACCLSLLADNTAQDDYLFSRDADVIGSGACGDNITWTLDANGVLTISGEGVVEPIIPPDAHNESDEYYPWNNTIRDRIAEKYGFHKESDDLPLKAALGLIDLDSYFSDLHAMVNTVIVEEGITGISRNAFYNYMLPDCVVLPASLQTMANTALDTVLTTSLTFCNPDYDFAANPVTVYGFAEEDAPATPQDAFDRFVAAASADTMLRGTKDLASGVYDAAQYAKTEATIAQIQNDPARTEEEKEAALAQLEAETGYSAAFLADTLAEANESFGWNYSSFADISAYLLDVLNEKLGSDFAAAEELFVLSSNGNDLERSPALEAALAPLEAQAEAASQNEYTYERFTFGETPAEGVTPVSWLTVHGYAGSTAETAAAASGVKFAPLCPNDYTHSVVESPAVEPTATTLGYTAGWYCEDCGRYFSGHQVIAPTTAVDCGYCGGEGDGTNLVWVLDNEGLLMIFGEGAMANYTASNPAPWSDYFAAPGASITVVLEEGVASIGTNTFPNTGLNELIVLNKLCDLSALEIRDPAMLRGYLGSTAEAYANRYDKLCVFKPLCEVDYRHTVEVIEGVDSTCKEQGHTPGLHCVECNNDFYGCEALPLENHTWGSWVTTKEATTETEGVRTRTCTVCDAKETQAIEKLTPTDTGDNDNNDDNNNGGFFGWLQRAMKGLVAWFQKLLRFFK